MSISSSEGVDMTVNRNAFKRKSIFSSGFLIFHNHVVGFARSTHTHAHRLLTIMVSYLCRLRVNCVGVFDVLTFDNSQTNHLALMPQYQVFPMMQFVVSYT